MITSKTVKQAVKNVKARTCQDEHYRGFGQGFWSGVAITWVLAGMLFVD